MINHIQNGKTLIWTFHLGWCQLRQSGQAVYNIRYVLEATAMNEIGYLLKKAY